MAHFVEAFHDRGYDEALLASLRRRPVAHTVWLLNRLINRAKSLAARRRYMDVMTSLLSHPLADATTLSQVNHFLDFQRKASV